MTKFGTTKSNRATSLPDPLPLMFSPSEVAAVAGVTPKSIRDHLNDGSIPGVRIGASWRIPRSYVLGLLAVGE